MNTDIIIHPKLQHYGLTTGNVDAMVEWYRKVLGMTINQRSVVPAGAPHGPPFSAFAFISNDETDHRIVFFEVPGVVADPDKRRHTHLQHVAFNYETLDELLGTYLRLKGIGILPLWAADLGVGISFYYQDPDQNVVELNILNYGNDWTATEFLRSSPASAVRPAPVDPEKLVAARQAGASPWELHERALAGEFAPTKTLDPSTHF
jgi:catechol 2,3-dioxygenase-like lactoylglutathione lyase family enzyme